MCFSPKMAILKSGKISQIYIIAKRPKIISRHFPYQKCGIAHITFILAPMIISEKCHHFRQRRNFCPSLASFPPFSKAMRCRHHPAVAQVGSTTIMFGIFSGFAKSYNKRPCLHFCHFTIYNSIFIKFSYCISCLIIVAE